MNRKIAILILLCLGILLTVLDWLTNNPALAWIADISIFVGCYLLVSKNWKDGKYSKEDGAHSKDV